MSGDKLSNSFLLSFEYPPVGGGISRLCGELVRAYNLEFEDNPINVLTQDTSDRMERDIHHRTVIRLPQVRPMREWQAYRYLKTNRPQNIISGLWYPEGLIAGLAKPEHHVILAHGLELMPRRNPTFRAPWEMLKRHVLNRASLVVSNSHYTKDLVKQVCPRCSVTAVPLAVNHKKFTPGEKAKPRQALSIKRPFVLGTVTRLFKYKGIDTVLEALASLPDDIRSKVEYLIAGDGPYAKELKARSEALGLGTQVRWLGRLDEHKLVKFYQALDCFVLCSEESADEQSVEGFGLVFLEAQACGIPVIGSRAGGIPDAIEHDNGGWLIPQKNSRALGELLLHLFGKPQLLKDQSERALTRVHSNFTWSHYVRRFSDALKEHDIYL